MSVNKFPPKFSQNILYPAVYDLDELDMPQGDYSLGTYFDVNWPEYGINGIPVLTYGKHSFTITLKSIDTMYNIQGFEVDESLPNFKKGSRILFEFKDSNGNTIFSDNTPIRQYDGFTNYIWIKQDPVRTFNDIQQGPATLTIVAKVQNNNPNWKNKYNIRSKQNIELMLYNADNNFYLNYSPIIFQHTTGSMGSGSGLVIDEVQYTTPEDMDTLNTYLRISASRMRTYSGEVDMIKSYIQVSASGDLPWHFIGDHRLKQNGSISDSSSYEDGIYKDYGEGLSPTSEKWDEFLPTEILAEHETNVWKVKFKLDFRNPYGDTAKSQTSGSETDFVLTYPNKPDDWYELAGGQEKRSTSGRSGAPDGWYEKTGAGQFSFNPKFNSSVPEGTKGGQKFKPDGTVDTIGDGSQGRTSG